MGLFEEHPYLMIPFVLSVVIGYDVVKYFLLTAISRRRNEAARSSRLAR